MHVTLPFVAFGLIGFWVVKTIAEAIYNVFFSPLRSIPGPLIAKITPQWLVYHDLAGRRTLTIHQLHEKYGSAVRVGPDEVSFTNVETVKELYSPQTAYMKALWYDGMSKPPLGVFSLRDKGAHAERRRLLSHVFSHSNILESESLIAQCVELFLEHVRDGAEKGQIVDMLRLCRLYSFDVVGELFLGQSFGALRVGAPPQFLQDIDAAFIILGLEWNLPLVALVVKSLPIPKLRSYLQAFPRMQAYAAKAFEKYLNDYGRYSGRCDLLTKMLNVKPDAADKMLSDEHIVQELMNLVHAGTDTTSTTLTYLFWELARNPEWQTKLRRELRKQKSENVRDDIMSYRKVQDLPILDAIINEGLRLHPAAPASLPRVVPAGGRILDGRFIPEKTVVSMQCYTTQRLPGVWTDPDTFKPDRWLAQSGSKDKLSAEALELFMPFSKGSRVCLGRSLALMEMKLVIAALIQQFQIKLAPDTTEESMTMEDHFLVVPKAHKCDLIFEAA